MTKMNRINNFKSDEALNDAQLETVAGGFVNDGGCIRLPTVLTPHLPLPGTFKGDVFAKHTIGQ
jgi:hypothetical protein